MFKKILIANRGEIAVRIIRAAREMKIQTVAVYSECDRLSLHVRFADEAYFLGPSPALESYLDIKKILFVATSSGCDAIHPGYGFLSENPEFARQCCKKKISFIGPSPESMELMGEKIVARRTASQAGVPIVPGTNTIQEDITHTEKIGRDIGYPLMVKAAAGGGGKGMRLVSSPKELESAIRDAKSEAQAAFGNASVYIEKFIQSPRHIEIQVLADGHGNIVHLGERECSIQRRHQKVIEECPSPLMTKELRSQMGQAAIKIAQKCSYRNAGTVEFIVDSQQNFFFLEMNTRLQVEHPTTEMVTGIDLVKRQIKIAAGEKLDLQQQDIYWKGTSIECRIYAEDPENQFFPSPGTIKKLQRPSGPGVREDSGIYEGYTVPIFYDPLLSKLIVWGENRSEAIGRMQQALGEYQISGIITNINFLKSILKNDKFASADLSTDFIEKYYCGVSSGPDHKSLEEVAIIAAALFSGQTQQKVLSKFHENESPWKSWGRWNGLRK